MSNKKLEGVLLNAGLTEKEASVYSSVMALGASTVLKISRSAGIKRTTVYSILESLKQKGLVHTEMSGFKQLYIAESPEKLSVLLDKQKSVFESSLPELMALYNFKGSESFIKYYEGIEAVKGVYENLLRDVRRGDDYLIIGDDAGWFQLDQDYFQEFIERRGRLDIKIRLLLQDSQEAQRHKKFERNFNETIKILPKDTVLNTNMVIIPARVVIHQLTPPISAIVIDAKSVVNMHREMFQIIWRSI